MADLRTRPDQVTEEAKQPAAQKRRWRRPLYITLAIAVVFVVYAFGFQVTDVNLEEIQDETRREQLYRVLRGLARPEILEFQRTEAATDAPIAVPCPAGGFNPGLPPPGPVVTMDPSCADPRATIAVSGSGFIPNSTARVFFVATGEIELRLDEVRVDENGQFTTDVLIPNRADPELQTIRVTASENIGSVFNRVAVPTGEIDSATGEEIVVMSPRWSQNALDTFDKIIETVFLALLATTFGTLIAIPLSFFAAKNLMREVRVPGLNMALGILAIPFGAALGLAVSTGAQVLVGLVGDNALVLLPLFLLFGWLSIILLRIAIPPGERRRGRLFRGVSALGGGITLLIAAHALARFAIVFGGAAADALGETFGFLGSFIETLGEILAAGFGVLAALAGAGLLVWMATKAGYSIARHVRGGGYTLVTTIASIAAGAMTGVAIGLTINWFYQINNVRTIVIWPALAGGLLGLLIAWRAIRRGSVSAGISIYFLSRTVFNTLRSIEPLVMAIVFVVWVGLGPFAGSLALALHTIAALSKLYSEQVESIAQGPLEAVKATGATRLQTIVYAVVPQIVAPYISFTMYRWDINVRMSTIIGFVGGGGIGLLLQQNIRLLNYRAAAAQMLAIAIVVATMDYVSSRLRERFV